MEYAFQLKCGPPSREDLIVGRLEGPAETQRSRRNGLLTGSEAASKEPGPRGYSSPVPSPRRPHGYQNRSTLPSTPSPARGPRSRKTPTIAAQASPLPRPTPSPRPGIRRTQENTKEASMRADKSPNVNTATTHSPAQHVSSSRPASQVRLEQLRYHGNGRSQASQDKATSQEEVETELVEEVLDLTQSDTNLQVVAEDEVVSAASSPPKDPQPAAPSFSEGFVAPSNALADMASSFIDFDPDEEDLLELDAAVDRAEAQAHSSVGDDVIDLDSMMANARSADVINLEDDDQERQEREENGEQRSALSWIQASQQFWLNPPPKERPTCNPHGVQEEDLVRFMWEGYDSEVVWSVGQVSSMNGDHTIITLLAQAHPYEDTGIMYRVQGSTAIPVPLESLHPFEGGPESFVDERDGSLGKRPRSHTSVSQESRSPAVTDNGSSGTIAKLRRR